jgi:integrase
MPAFLLTAVTTHRAQLGLSDDDILCRTSRGGLLRCDRYNRLVWKPALTAAGLSGDTTFHDLRHTFASTALAEGVPISEVSRWLGHRSITTTVDLYGNSRELHQTGEEPQVAMSGRTSSGLSATFCMAA